MHHALLLQCDDFVKSVGQFLHTAQHDVCTGIFQY